MNSDTDQVEAMLGTPLSIFGRVFVGLAPLAAGLLINLSDAGAEVFEHMAAVGFIAVFTVVGWLQFGLLGILFGFATYFGMVVGFYFVLRDECGKKGYFAMFTVAAVHYLPWTFASLQGGSWRWIGAPALYGLISAIYWYHPWLIARFRQAPTETDASGLPPKTAFQTGWERQSAYPPTKPES